MFNRCFRYSLGTKAVVNLKKVKELHCIMENRHVEDAGMERFQAT
jgi:hypothetical protein